jgi:predicted RNA polymerase sigma factor
MPRDGQPVHEAAERVARNGYGKLVAFLAARTRDVAAAEDALADAFAAALTNWTANGIPRNPEAWLIAVARRKAIEAGRRKRNSENAVPDLRMISEELAGPIGLRSSESTTSLSRLPVRPSWRSTGQSPLPRRGARAKDWPRSMNSPAIGA